MVSIRSKLNNPITLYVNTKLTDQILHKYGINKDSPEKVIKKVMRKILKDYFANKLSSKELSDIGDRILYGYHNPLYFQDIELRDLLDDISELEFNETKNRDTKTLTQIYESMRSFQQSEK